MKYVLNISIYAQLGYHFPTDVSFSMNRTLGKVLAHLSERRHRLKAKFSSSAFEGWFHEGDEVARLKKLARLKCLDAGARESGDEHAARVIRFEPGIALGDELQRSFINPSETCRRVLRGLEERSLMKSWCFLWYFVWKWISWLDVFCSCFLGYPT